MQQFDILEIGMIGTGFDTSLKNKGVTLDIFSFCKNKYTAVPPSLVIAYPQHIALWEFRLIYMQTQNIPLRNTIDSFNISTLNAESHSVYLWRQVESLLIERMLPVEL